MHNNQPYNNKECGNLKDLKYGPILYILIKK